jgi:predicted RNA-binding Zn-ribbon protein involved in translation (DUF1610 family)
MTTIRTSCPMCGDVELAPLDLSLQLTPGYGSGSYSFVCPHCEQVQHRPADNRVASILLATGVAYEVIERTGPITDQEIRAFVASMDHDDWREQMPS